MCVMFSDISRNENITIDDSEEYARVKGSGIGGSDEDIAAITNGFL